ncbi:MAG: hypothetical protein Q8P97_00415, partial [bacterium]|nr:hypothetical protein [bacterium]
QVLEQWPDKAIAFVVVGRPYTAWDPGVNMKVASRILDLGVMAIPQDYLPLSEANISSDWGFIYSRQIQKKLAAAKIINRDPRLRAIVLSYFGCGPDSFANQFLVKVLGNSYFVMNIDEHTGDAHTITRLEAYYDTVRHAKKSKESIVELVEDPMTNLGNRILWIPQANESAKALAAAMRAYGVNAQALKRSPDKGLTLAREAITEDVCLPSLMTVEDMLWRIHEPDFDADKEAFFMGNSNGPCRFGMYHALMRQILDSLGHQNVKIATLGIKTAHGGLGMKFAVTAWKALVTNDLLFKMMLKTRPYEIDKGSAERVLEAYVRRLEIVVQKERGRLSFGTLANTDLFEEMLKEATNAFSMIDIKNEDRPLVGVIGEFFVRIHDEANQDLLRTLESLGAETWLAPGATEFFSYANYIGLVHLREKIAAGAGSIKDWQSRSLKWLNWKLMTKVEHDLFHACLPFLSGYDDVPSEEIVKLGSRYIHPDFGGEAICSSGKSVDFCRRGTVFGIVNVIPFNCLPGNIMEAISEQVRDDEDGIPFITLVYNGYTESRRPVILAEFMAQVHERYKCQQLPDPGLRLVTRIKSKIHNG